MARTTLRNHQFLLHICGSRCGVLRLPERFPEDEENWEHANECVVEEKVTDAKRRCIPPGNFSVSVLLRSAHIEQWKCIYAIYGDSKDWADHWDTRGV